jgi:hypothetical protein
MRRVKADPRLIDVAVLEVSRGLAEQRLDVRDELPVGGRLVSSL